jgi:hypothetical protein
VQRHDPLRVAAFGHPRISAGWRLPEAYRSLPRPSSAPGAKASPVRPCLRRARSLAGAPHAGSCALLQAMHLLKAWTTPPWAVAPGSSVPVATPHCSVSSRYSDRPTVGSTSYKDEGRCRGHKNRPGVPPAGCCLLRGSLILKCSCSAAARSGLPSRSPPHPRGAQSVYPIHSGAAKRGRARL